MFYIEAMAPMAERVLLCLGERPSAQITIRAAARMATELKARLYALYVERPGASTRRPPEVAAQLARNQRLARDLGAQVEVVYSHQVAAAILAFAHAHEVSRIMLGRSRRTWWQRILCGDIVEQIRRGSGRIAVYVIDT